MDDGGGFALEIQAREIAQNATRYKGSSPCPTCGIIMNPVEVLYSKGMCPSCYSQDRADRVKRKMA